MSDTTITPEEKAEWRSLVMPYPDGTIGNQDKRMLRLLNALEQAEARAEEYKGFITALVAGLRQRWPRATAAMTCEDCTAGDVFSSVLDPIVLALTERAEKAEAENARLTQERDWLATQLACIQSAYDIDQKTRDWSTARWAEAARRAVAESGVKE